MAQQTRIRTLLAGTAVAALALTGCTQGGGGGDDDGGSPSAAEPAPAPEAPADYTTEQVESTLAAASVVGEPVEDVTPTEEALGGVSAEDGVELMETLLADASIEPQECHDPILGQLSGGALEDVMAESVMGTTAGGLMITAFPMDSKEAADQHVDDLRQAYDQCGDVTLELLDEQLSIATTTEQLEVDGAGAAISQDAELEAGEERQSSASAMMSVGNVVISVTEPGSAMAGADSTGEPGDQASRVEEIDPAYVLEEIAPPSSRGRRSRPRRPPTALRQRPPRSPATPPPDRRRRRRAA